MKLKCLTLENFRTKPSLSMTLGPRLAMLVRRTGASLSSLLHRLDAAIEEALEREIFVAEINDGT
ncbi:hypothetical protein MKP05_03755 [Halomonas sp. EGI 63088]|uniref:Uncharacterized protein n=1 Tax=Halomonas flagellata TaxID=2920385 RepID=A0ABS9RQY4_9GAMM|nr:hypothetical protein [Halomonas flagellata]MCH4562245.1 hypothetical protein [Halomonas flagellata]